MSLTLTCQHCRAPLDVDPSGGGGYRPCPGCGLASAVRLFPAAESAVPVPSEPSAVVSDEAACFFHAGYQAAASCKRCGRFLCALCDLPLGEEHYCAPCIEAGRKDGSLTQVRTGSIRWDVLVLFLALFPIVLFPFISLSLFTAPLALGLGVYCWRRPVSMVHTLRGLTAIGMTLALLQAGLWGAGLFWILYQLISS